MSDIARRDVLKTLGAAALAASTATMFPMRAGAAADLRYRPEPGASLQVMREEPWRRDTVLGHAARFRAEAAALGLRLASSVSPIQPLLLGTESSALDASAALRDQGIFVPAIRPPTVPAGTSRLRITFSAAHTDPGLDRLLESLAGLLQRGLLS